MPADSANKHNERHARLTFNLRDRAVCHGLAGYFEAVLYPGVELSTNPINVEEKSPGMMSWFPLFFSLKVSFSPYLIFASLGFSYAHFMNRYLFTSLMRRRLQSPYSVRLIIGRCGTNGW